MVTRQNRGLRVMRESRPGNPGAAQLATADPSLSHCPRAESSQVNWYDGVHLFVKPWLAAVASWPMAGTIAWQLLDDTDPTKWAAILDAAQHHILRLELNQEARAEASRAVSCAADWPEVAREMLQLQSFRAARPWLRRAAS